MHGLDVLDSFVVLGEGSKSLVVGNRAVPRPSVSSATR